MLGAQLLNVVFDILCVGGDDRAVVMVSGVFKLCPFIRDTRIEYVFDAFVDQPFNMAMCELGRVTLGFTWDRFDAEFINLPCGRRREDNAVF